MKKEFCDICGKEITQGKVSFLGITLKSYLLFRHPDWVKYELCNDCGMKVRKYVETLKSASKEKNFEAG